jgi:hypothetical protein
MCLFFSISDALHRFCLPLWRDTSPFLPTFHLSALLRTHRHTLKQFEPDQTSCMNPPSNVKTARVWQPGAGSLDRPDETSSHAFLHSKGIRDACNVSSEDPSAALVQRRRTISLESLSRRTSPINLHANSLINPKSRKRCSRHTPLWLETSSH